MVSESFVKFPTRLREALNLLVVLLVVCIGSGCATRAPTIAHVHVGHAITGFHDTPDRAGLFVLAEDKSRQALDLVERTAVASRDAKFLNEHVNGIYYVLYLGDQYPLDKALKEAASHISFAAESADASANVKAGAARFEDNMEGVLYRSDLLKLYAGEANPAASLQEASQVAEEVARLVKANWYGEDADGNGVIGNTPQEYGVVQLRRDLDALVAAEDPPYRTVDRWYLFNLIRLPNGDWMFRRGSSGGSQSY